MKNVTVKRVEREWTITELSRRARIHPSRMGQIESGRVVPPQGSVELKRLARALRWTDDPAALLEEVAN